MTPVLFYIPGTCAFGSIVALEWVGLPFRLCRLDKDSVKSKGEILTESTAILQHIGFLGIEKGLTCKQGTSKFDQLKSTWWKKRKQLLSQHVLNT